MEPQPILTPLTSAAIFLLATINPGGESTARGVLADFGGLCRTVGFREPEGILSCVVGIGSDAYARLFDGRPPAGLHPFRRIEGPRHVAVATPADLLFHIRARRMDLCFEFADQLSRRLAGTVTVVDEVNGFRYFDERDLLGFVDGTENPTGRSAASAVLIGVEDPDFAGGSYVIVQKYLHDIAAWDALSTEEQERAIGRMKLSNVELSDDVKPSNSHVALTTIEDQDGTERQIVRDNMPFGGIASGERGTYFIGYSADPTVIEQMLTNMFVGNPPGNTDRILEFSRAVTGALFFVPTLDFLDDLPPAPAAEVQRAVVTSPASTVAESLADNGPDDQTLHIGSLNPRVGAKTS
jgi:putative iron-dependent peroxidase